MKTLSKEKALFRAKAICSRQEKCKADILKKLKNWNAKTNDIDEIISTLEKENYIDEKRYTTAFVNDKIKFNKWGKLKILQNLKFKSIPESIIRQSLEEVDEDLYKEIAQHEIEKKHKSLKYGKTGETKAKLLRFGASRGFESEIIYTVINSLLS